MIIVSATIDTPDYLLGYLLRCVIQPLGETFMLNLSSCSIRQGVGFPLLSSSRLKSCIKKSALSLCLVSSALSSGFVQADAIDDALREANFLERQVRAQLNGINNDRNRPGIQRVNLWEMNRGTRQDIVDLGLALNRANRQGLRATGSIARGITNIVRLTNDAMANALQVDGNNLIRGVDAHRGGRNTGPFRLAGLAGELGRNTVATAGVATLAIVAYMNVHRGTMPLTRAQAFGASAVAIGAGAGFIRGAVQALWDIADFFSRRNADARAAEVRMRDHANHIAQLHWVNRETMLMIDNALHLNANDRRALRNDLRRTMNRVDPRGSDAAGRVGARAIREWRIEEDENDRGL